ncbi:MAG: crossover junction endodeoxyribonuclease RuvC, partial [Bacteroidales bacterium]|nr:crossover junction endodeoxyribonuclease RuvC [Bacteroidales bacterium]
MPGKERIILGIDPGTRIMGYGIIKAEGQKFSFVDMGVVNMTQEADPLLRLERIQQEVTR